MCQVPRHELTLSCGSGDNGKNCTHRWSCKTLGPKAVLDHTIYSKTNGKGVPSIPNALHKGLTNYLHIVYIYIHIERESMGIVLSRA